MRTLADDHRQACGDRLRWLAPRVQRAARGPEVPPQSRGREVLVTAGLRGESTRRLEIELGDLVSKLQEGKELQPFIAQACAGLTDVNVLDIAILWKRKEHARSPPRYSNVLKAFSSHGCNNSEMKASDCDRRARVAA